MPPEPLPWDRKDFFREKRHNNGYDTVSEPLGGSVARWRDSPSHGSRSDFGRWGFPSDFRRHPGHCKQGGWHRYPEDVSHGYATTRSGDRFFHDGGGFRPSGPYRDGRYNRNFRETRASFNHKDWRGHSWDYNHHHGTTPSGPGRLYDGKDQRSVDGASTWLSHPHSDVANTSNQLQSKEQSDEPCNVNESGMSQRVEKDNSLASTDWKPFKWSRLGSLTSRVSGSSKSSGDSCELKIELPLKIATPDESSSGDAVGCIASPASLEDTTSKKKPRLGWGQGLAKYEKKKVECPDGSQTKSALCTSNIESMHSPAQNLVDKSPRIGGSFDCRSPMTPSSVAYSSSPGLDDKSCMKAAEVDSDANNLSPSPTSRSQNHFEGHSLNLENMELKLFFNLNELLNELLQNEDQSSVDSGSIKTSALNKLLLLKGNILKDLELAESEIDSLENELKSLKSHSGSNSPCPESSSSMSIDCKEKPSGELTMIQRPSLLMAVSSDNVILEAMVPRVNVIEDVHAEVKDEYIDSPGTATSKLMEPLSADKSPSLDQRKHVHSEDMVVVESAKYEVCASAQGLNTAGSSASDSEDEVAKGGNASVNEDIAVCDNLEDNYILSSNKEIAIEASKLFSNSLPCSGCDIESIGAISSRYSQNNLLIKEKLLKRKQSLRFKERALSLKYKVFQYLWKEDLQLLSERKNCTKTEKKFEPGFRSLHSGFQKHRSSVRARFASSACNLSLLPTSEVVSFTSKLLSDPHVRCYRNSLKMPVLVLDKEKMLPKFLSNNGLVQDPCAVERERTLINPWTAEEKEIFMDKYATFGNDFRKISSFLDHKTTADCIEFYYKNHKSDCFKKTKQRELKKQEKSAPTTRYLMTSGRNWSKEMNAASLDMLGAASAIVAHDDVGMKSAKIFSSNGSDRKLRGNDIFQEISSSFDIDDERETEVADVLAGICGSLSSEAMSSCITSSADPGDGTQDWKSWKTSSEPSGNRCSPTAVVMQNVDDDTCSDESCGYMDPVDWTDEEKSSFVQAFSSYGKDFVMISRCVQTKSRDQCKVFFSKARKCLGLGMLNPDPGHEIAAPDHLDGDRSDTEDACVVESDLATCGEKLSDRTDENMAMPVSNINHDHDDDHMNLHDSVDLSDECVPVQLDENDLNGSSQDLFPQDCQPENTSEVVPDDGVVFSEEVENTMKLQYHENGDASVASDDGEEPDSGDDTPMTNAVIDAAKTCASLSDEQNEVVSVIAIQKSKSERGGQDEQKQSASTNGLCQPFPGQTSPQHCESRPMGKGSLSFSMQMETSVVPSLLQPSTRPCASRTETSVLPFQVYLKKCHRHALVHCVGELPLLSISQSQTLTSRSYRQCSPDESEKQCRNGDVKLFGQILSKSDKPTSDMQGSSSSSGCGCEGRSILCPSSCSSLDMLSVNNEMDKYADNNGSLGLENSSLRSYGIWDGNRIQTGYSSLPNSALVVAKYPAVFTTVSRSASTLEELQQKLITNSNKSRLASVASSSVGGLAECQHVYATKQDGMQPYKLEMKQDIFTDVPRNGFEAVSGPQQIKLNVVQGDRAAGACNGLTDPIAALKLHYAKAQQYGLNLGDGKEEGSWRGQNGDLGR